ncbi:MAG: hypothetical protein IPJ67_01675 [Candidatus Moraniibacteriota bacterium]|nr:MAG: hypothetical protein IPJ67_01675 [Candidatus Moranbacteria bacterium]
MKKISFLVMPIAFAVLSLSGCSFPGASSSGSGSAILKSMDGGKTYVPKVTIDAKTTIAPADILSVVFEASNPNHITVGTRENGIFTSENGGDVWKKMNFPPTKTYGLVADWSNPARLYATGDWQGRGKMYKSEDHGVKWDEIYTEPNTGTVITMLAQNPKHPETLYAGTSTGVVFRTTDSGQTWGSLQSVDTPALALTFDSAGDTFYVLSSKKGIFRSQDGGVTLEAIPSGKSKSSVTKTLPEVTSFASDPSRSGTLYAGTKNGLFRSRDFGDSWEEVSVIESSKKFSVRSIAINPHNSNELLYGAALAVYKSVDGGLTWSVYQLDANRAVGTIRYSPSDSNTLYLGLRTF